MVRVGVVNIVCRLITGMQLAEHLDDTFDAYRRACNVRWVPAVNPPPHGTHPDGKSNQSARYTRASGGNGAPALTTVLPNGVNASPASLNEATPNGIPMIVMHNSTPVIT